MLGDRPDSEFRLAGCSELANDDDVERTLEAGSDWFSNRHASARKAEHDRVLVPIFTESLGELPAGFETIAKHRLPSIASWAQRHKTRGEVKVPVVWWRSDGRTPAWQRRPAHQRETKMVDTTRVLECRGLQKSYGERKAVDGVGFHIDLGETYGLLGPNGAGKTTTISMVCGLLRRDAGEVKVVGEAIDVGQTHAKRWIGYVPQDLAIYPDLTAEENLAFFGRLYGLTGKALRNRMEAVLEVTGLSDRRADKTEEYSGGMKRRLNIGIGLLHEPSLLILDEPTVGVDPQSRNAILDSVEQLSGEGMAVLYTTHYMEEAERLCDRVGIIDQGQVKAEGTRRQLVELVGQHDRIRVIAEGDVDGAATAARSVDGVEEVNQIDNRLDILTADARVILPTLLLVMSTAGAAVKSVDVVEPDLEAVFLHLTGKALRD